MVGGRETQHRFVFIENATSRALNCFLVHLKFVALDATLETLFKTRLNQPGKKENVHPLQIQEMAG
jgi:hypothetical protein